MTNLFNHNEKAKEGEALTREEKERALKHLTEDHAQGCPHCAPQKNQLNIVFGEGNPEAKIMFIGEGPGEEEDRQGRPFVGRAGKLLDKEITAMGLKREDVYIANIVKVRPPGNRVPLPSEAAQCSPYLIRQIKIIKPAVLVLLGATSLKYLLGDMAASITRLRGTWQEYQGIPTMPTFHPAYLLRAYTPENRKLVWEDLKKALVRAELPVPKENN